MPHPHWNKISTHAAFVWQKGRRLSPVLPANGKAANLKVLTISLWSTFSLLHSPSRIILTLVKTVRMKTNFPWSLVIFRLAVYKYQYTEYQVSYFGMIQLNLCDHKTQSDTLRCCSAIGVSSHVRTSHYRNGWDSELVKHWNFCEINRKAMITVKLYSA